jgi:hypothetical protein
MIRLLWLIPALPLASALVLVVFGGVFRAEQQRQWGWDRSDSQH